MKGKTIVILAFLAGTILLAGCGLQKFPEDRYLDTNAPEPPDGVGITNIVPGIRQITVDWNSSPSPNVNDYMLYLSTDGAQTFDSGRAVGNVTSYVITLDDADQALQDGTEYFVRIRAMSFAGVESEPPDAVQASATTAPTAPTALIAQGSNQDIDLTWNLSASDTVVGYYVYMYNPTSTLWDHLNYLDTSLATPYVTFPVTVDRDASGTPLAAGATYSFRVTAYDAYPLESDYVETLNAGIFPAEVTNLRATGGDQRVFLTWNPTGNINADYYLITVTPTIPPGLSWAPIQVPATESNYTVLGLTNGDTYDFLVQVHLTTGASSPGLTVTGVPTATQDNTPPEDPANLIATPGDSQISLTWQGSPSQDCIGYQLGYKESSSATWNYISLGFINNYTVPSLVNGTSYDFELRARDPAGNLSVPGITASATPGRPSIGIRFSKPGGVYRYGGATATLPSRLYLYGTVNENETAGGTIYFTTDGSNPSTSGSSVANGGFIDLQAIAASARYIILKAFFHDSAGSGEYGLTISETYHFYPVDAGVLLPVGGIIEQRRDHTAHLITNPLSPLNGEVVIFGGYNDGTSSVTDGTEVFDPLVEFFYQDNTASGEMTYLRTPRMEHRSVTLDDGRILLVGGRWRPVSDILADLCEGPGGAAGQPYGEIFDPANPLTANTQVDGSGQILHTATQLTNRVWSPWITGTAYALGDTVQSSAKDEYQCTTAGTSGVAEPAWDTTIGNTTNDGTVVWTRIAPNNQVLITGGIVGLTPNGPYTCSDNSTQTSLVVAGMDLTASGLNVAAPGYFIRFEDPTGPVYNFTTFITNATYSPPPTDETTLTISPATGFDPGTGNPQFRITPTDMISCAMWDPASPGDTSAPFNLPEERFGHTSTLLQDGRVFITGGHPDYWWYIDTKVAFTTLLFDPHTAQFERAGTGDDLYFRDNSARLSTPRFFHTATLLKDGRVLVVGGLNEPWGYFAGLRSGGSFWAITPLSSSDIYNPMDDTAVVGPTMTTGRFLHAAILLNDGRVLVTGGIDWLANTSGIPDETNSAEIFNPATNKWEATGSMISKRARHTMTMLPDGRILVAGGIDNHLCEVYDPITGKFTGTAGTLTNDRYFQAKSVKMGSGKVLVAGGQARNFIDRSSEKEVSGSITNAIEILSPSETIFRDSQAALITPRRSHSMTLLDDARILIAGGWGGQSGLYSGLSSSEIYAESSDSIAAAATLSGPRYGHGAVKLNGERFYSVATATFDGTTSVDGIGTDWDGEDDIADNADDPIRPNDRIKLNADPNGAYFEVVVVVSATELTIRSGGGHGYAIPTGTGTYTVRTERPYTEGNAVFTFGQSTVSSPDTVYWTQHLRAGDLIRPAGYTRRWFKILSVDSDTSLTLEIPYTGDDSPVAGEPYVAQGNGRILLIGGGASGQSLNTADIFDPYADAFYTADSNMALTRFAMSATLLQNGWVLVVGGNSNYDRTAELYDPAMNRFRSISDITKTYWDLTANARNNHKAALMDNGYVFIGGGDVNQGYNEYFMPDAYPAVTDGDGDGIAAIDIGQFGTANVNFVPVTASMAEGRAAHSLTRVVGNHSDGYATFTNGLATVTGLLTTWNGGVLNPGDLIRADRGLGSPWYRIQSVDSATQVTLTAPFDEPTTTLPNGERYAAGPEVVLMVGGTTSGSAAPSQASSSGETMTWVPAAPATSTMSGLINIQRNYGYHPATELSANGNVVLFRGHSIVIFFSR